MFDIGAQELLLTAVVAIVVIGPKDLPRALRMAGGWIAKIRRVSGHFRSGIEEMIRQAELEDMEKKWREKNEAIMREEALKAETDTGIAPEPASAEAALPDYRTPDYRTPDYRTPDYHASETPVHEPASEASSPELPLAPPTQKS